MFLFVSSSLNITFSLFASITFNSLWIYLYLSSKLPNTSFFHTFHSFFIPLNFSLRTYAPHPCTSNLFQASFTNCTNLVLEPIFHHTKKILTQSTMVFFNIKGQWYEIFLSRICCVDPDHLLSHSLFTKNLLILLIAFPFGLNKVNFLPSNGIFLISYL